VFTQIRHFRTALEAFEKAMQSPDPQALRQLIEQARQVRSGWVLQTGQTGDED
jgi:prephenate dehydrogenase